MTGKSRNQLQGFTIVELLIVIVVIAILATISIVAYNGIQERAGEAALLSDTTQAGKQLKLFQVDKGRYPASVSTDCAATPDSDTSKCLKLSGGNTVDSYSSPSPHSTYSLKISNASGSLSHVLVNSQVWAGANLNVGVMVPINTAQTNNGTIEKYCYNDDEANCTTYGALYLWDEAMAYSTSPGAQGICPAGWHIPTDDEWKTLEISLGMSQTQADATNWRGTDQGTQLKPGGISGLSIPLAGYRASSPASAGLGSAASVWSSSELVDRNWRRVLEAGNATVLRHPALKSVPVGSSVRCLQK